MKTEPAKKERRYDSDEGRVGVNRGGGEDISGRRNRLENGADGVLRRRTRAMWIRPML